jgi:hypothetical protein
MRRPGLATCLFLFIGAGAACSSSSSPSSSGQGTDGGAGGDSSVHCCSSSSSGGDDGGGGAEGGAGGESGADGAATCQTEIAVTVLDPSGRYALPGVSVFVSNGTLPTIEPGVMNACPAIGNGAVKTPADGTAASLTVTSLPGSTEQVVAQIGKWRVTGSAKACQASTLKLTLPAAGPAIAISTGKGDSTECALHRMGLDPVVTVYAGAGGAQTTPAASSSPGALWDMATHLEAYDAVILSCEAALTTSANAPALSQYLQAKGMVFAEHWHYAWFDVAPFAAENIAVWAKGLTFDGHAATVTASTPAEVLRQQWLASVKALSATGDMVLTAADGVATLGATYAATAWMTEDVGDSGVGTPTLFSWTEPVAGPPAGRVVFSTFHVGATSGDYGQAAGPEDVPATAAFPSGCATESDLTPEEKAFVYSLFVDLSCAP